MAAGDEFGRSTAAGDQVMAVKQLVSDIDALPQVLDVHAAWNADDTAVALFVVLAEFDWDVRRTVIEMIDRVHRAHVDTLTIDFDVVDRDHRPFAELM